MLHTHFLLLALSNPLLASHASLLGRGTSSFFTVNPNRHLPSITKLGISSSFSSSLLLFPLYPPTPTTQPPLQATKGSKSLLASSQCDSSLARPAFRQRLPRLA
ncbi:hypothetical protein B0T14DRAFT_501420 [Immersiella caudata]|uniref:Uncharacterized protein n=1 Tax=Immersiella caudata TaxID=314043 RepID=A0AA40CA87_9PEZI|nr:hypothetical protein B0T14DRAFT_501420 [Immersiella caudata]